MYTWKVWIYKELSSQSGVKTGAYYIFHESRNTVIIEKKG